MTDFEHTAMVIDRMRKRPGMYLGKISLNRLYLFLGGCEMGFKDGRQAGYDREKIAADTPLPFWFFHEFAAKKFGYAESTAGWAKIIAESLGDGTMDSWNAFLEVFDEFAALRVKECKGAVLTEENIRHCDERPVSIFRVRNGVFCDGKEYEFPEKVFIITLTNGMEIVLVECVKSMSAAHRLQLPGKGVSLCRKLFGKIDNFKSVDIRDIPCEKELVIT